MSFQNLNLNKPLWNALEELEFTDPTPIQTAAIPIIMSGKDTVGTAQTGTGKTLAYLLPILRQLPYSEIKHPRVLILVPTRELVTQVLEEVNKLTKYMSIVAVGIYGGTNINTQKQIVYGKTDVLIATPGRLFDLVSTGILRVRNVQKLVVDEVDQMMGLGFRQQLYDVMDTLPLNRQNILFSATINDEVEKVIKKYFNEPEFIEIEAYGTPLEKIKQTLYEAPNHNSKINLLVHLLKEDESMNKVLLFVSTKRIADKIFDQINPYLPKQVGVIHSSKSQNFRNQTIAEFKEGKIKVLIASDVAARGLDIKNVSHVVNFHIPEVVEDYIHRIGRTGRAGQDGVAISLCTEEEMDNITRIETTLQLKIENKDWPSEAKVSSVLIDDEKEKALFDINYRGTKAKREAGPAFHEKKGKNKKVNLGGPAQREKLKGKDAKIRSRRHN